MTDFYSQNRCVCSTRSHGPLLCAFCLSFHFNKSYPSILNSDLVTRHIGFFGFISFIILVSGLYSVIRFPNSSLLFSSK